MNIKKTASIIVFLTLIAESTTFGISKEDNTLVNPGPSSKAVNKEKVSLNAPNAAIKTDVEDTAKSNDEFLIDQIACVVHGTERSQIFCLSDKNRQMIGQAESGDIKQLVTNELIYQDALRFKIPIDEAVIDAYISSIQQQYNLSMKDVENIFLASGYSLSDGRDQLRMMYAINAIIEGRIKQNLVVPEKDVIAYYEANPEVIEAKFKIQIAFFNHNTADEGNELGAVLKAIADNTASWSEPIWLNKSDIASHLQFIVAMKPGELSAPVAVQGGYEVYKLLEMEPESIMPLAKRYREIVDILRRPKFAQLFTDYKQSLFNSASVLYFIPESELSIPNLSQDQDIV